MRAILIAGIMMAALSAGGAEAASFDCTAAKSDDEKAICSDMALSDLDVKMATLFEVATHLVAMGQRGTLQDEQRQFLVERASCGADRQCLRLAYQGRINVIQKVLQGIYARGPF